MCVLIHLFCSSSSVRPGGKSLPEDLLWAGPAVRRDGGNRPRRVRLPGEVPALVCARVWFRRPVLREPLWGVPHCLPGTETYLCGPQQRLLLQRYHLTSSDAAVGQTRQQDSAFVWMHLSCFDACMDDTPIPARNTSECCAVSSGGVQMLSEDNSFNQNRRGGKIQSSSLFLMWNLSVLRRASITGFLSASSSVTPSNHL